MILIFFTWAATTALYGFLLWLAVRRVMAHLQGNAEATRMVVEHVLMPVIGRRPSQEATDVPAKVDECSLPSASPESREQPQDQGVPADRRRNLLGNRP
jgi:hypothetical protein